MTEQIKKVLDYKEADLKVDAAEKKVKGSKERKTANAMKQRYELAVEERKKLISLRDEAENEVNQIAKEVEKLTSIADADRAKDAPDDVDAISKLVGEIDKLISSLKKYEDKLVKVNSALDENEKKINEYAVIANKAKEEFNINKAGYEKLVAENKPEIEALRAERDKIQVDPALLNKYMTLKKNKIVPTAPLQNKRCGGCHMELPAFTVSNATKNGYCECENCARIVYVE